jgi:hypothetical protein
MKSNKIILIACFLFSIGWAITTVAVVMLDNPFEESTAFQKVVLFVMTFPFDWMTVFGLIFGFTLYILFYTLIFGLLLILVRWTGNLIKGKL